MDLGIFNTIALQGIVLCEHLLMLLDQLLTAFNRIARSQLFEHSRINLKLAHHIWLRDKLNKQLVKVLFESQMLDLIETLVFLDSLVTVHLSLFDSLVQVLHTGSHFDICVYQLLHAQFLVLSQSKQFSKLQRLF